MIDPDDDKSEFESWSIYRRSYVVASITGIAGALGGCSGNAGKPDNGDQDSGRTREVATPNEVAEAKRQVEQVFELIKALPIADGAEFVFDVENSMESVDHGKMAQKAEEALEVVEGLDKDVGISPKRRHELNRTARVAFLLVDQRILVHKSILGGLVYKREFDHNRYARTVEVMKEARELLEQLRSNGRSLQDEIGSYGETHLGITRAGKDSIRRDLDMVLDVLRWMIPVYEGFDEVGKGMVDVQKGNKNLEDERYESASESYQLGKEHFARAEAAFDVAHGTGKSVDYISQIVGEFRCYIPILNSGYGDLGEAFADLEDGIDPNGQKKARATLSKMDEEFNKCI